MGASEFEDTVFTCVEEDPTLSAQDSDDERNPLNSATVATQLLDLLSRVLPEQVQSSKEVGDLGALISLSRSFPKPEAR